MRGTAYSQDWVRCTDGKCKDGGTVLVAPHEEWTPQDGEVCFVQDFTSLSAVFIYDGKGGKRTSAYIALFNFGGDVWLTLDRGDCVYADSHVDILRPATDYERKLLFKCLDENNLSWNADARTLESTRWRAGKGEMYYYIILGETKYEVVDMMDMRMDNDWCRYLSGNYFKTRDAAVETASQIMRILKKSKAE